MTMSYTQMAAHWGLQQAAIEAIADWYEQGCPALDFVAPADRHWITDFIDMEKVDPNGMERLLEEISRTARATAKRSEHVGGILLADLEKSNVIPLTRPTRA